jgi:phage-related tail protein
MPKKQVVLNEGGKPTGVIQFTFEDNTVQLIDVNGLSEETKFRAMVHGISQKIGDSYAGAKAEENPLAFAKAACAETIAQVERNEWRAPSAGGGPRVTDLAVALSRATGQTLEASVEYIGTLDENQVKELRGKAKIKAMLATVAAEKAIAKAKKLTEEAANAPE